MSRSPGVSREPSTTQEPQPSPGRSWAERYGEKYDFRRVTDFPTGVQAPRRVRIYRRDDGLLLQWWDPGRKRNTAERIEGDLISAIVRARQIEERLSNFKSGGPARRGRVAHAELVTAFLNDLRKRADSGDIDPATVRRYSAALGHYLAFWDQAEVARAYPHAASVNRDFRLGLAAFLAQRQVTPNGRARGEDRPLKGQDFVLDTVRALFEWGADSERGDLLPEGFRNPFRHSSSARSVLRGDPLSEPDITSEMAVDLVGACDYFHLRLFVPMLLFGLRAAEPCYLFLEYFEGDWLRVPNNLDLDYRTKGRRDKRFPTTSDPCGRSCGGGSRRGCCTRDEAWSKAGKGRRCGVSRSPRWSPSIAVGVPAVATLPPPTANTSGTRCSTRPGRSPTTRPGRVHGAGPPPALAG